MTTLVVVETILLALLTLLVAGLLRSHAEILRRLESSPAAPGPAEGSEALAPARAGDTPAFDLAGSTLDGDAVTVSVSGGTSTLLAFLSSGCPSCRELWRGLHADRRPRVPGGARIVTVTKDPAFESPSRLRELAPPDVPLVMSSAAWESYAVRGSPYFIYVDGRSGTIVGEGTAPNWTQVLSLLRDAFDDAAVASARAPSPVPAAIAAPTDDRAALDSLPGRIRRADRELRAAGLYPGHPSLYGRPAEDEAEGRDGRD